ncbi:MAG: hypothetical protein ACRD1E_13370, partial [Terriglobales bacterium]
MPLSTHKKVVLLHRTLGLISGYLDPGSLDSALPAAQPGAAAAAEHPLAMVRPTGEALALAPEQVLAVYFVSAFGREADLRALGAVGRGSPRQPGGGVRLRLRAQHRAEGILLSDRLVLERG